MRDVQEHAHRTRGFAPVIMDRSDGHADDFGLIRRFHLQAGGFAALQHILERIADIVIRDLLRVIEPFFRNAQHFFQRRVPVRHAAQLVHRDDALAQPVHHIAQAVALEFHIGDRFGKLARHVVQRPAQLAYLTAPLVARAYLEIARGHGHGHIAHFAQRVDDAPHQEKHHHENERQHHQQREHQRADQAAHGGHRLVKRHK